KAYCTRVGGGPFPTELNDATGELLRNIGSEFGATTGRPRRCGWIDLIALQFACMVNGVTQIIMTKTDILDSLPELKVCNGYMVDGEDKNYIPFQLNKVQVDPVYKRFDGWETDITSIEKYEALPENMKNYIDYINKFLQVPVKFISNGPGRDQIVLA
ncbi:MAG: adenylosuccinate synthetase, partial [Ferruginibacter sp.]